MTQSISAVVIKGCMLTTGAWYLLVAYLFSQSRIRRFYFGLMPYMNALFGVLWILLAAKLIFA